MGWKVFFMTVYIISVVFPFHSGIKVCWKWKNNNFTKNHQQTLIARLPILIILLWIIFHLSLNNSAWHRQKIIFSLVSLKAPEIILYYIILYSYKETFILYMCIKSRSYTDSYSGLKQITWFISITSSFKTTPYC